MLNGEELLARAEGLEALADELRLHLEEGRPRSADAWHAWERLSAAARYLRDAAVFTLRDEARGES